MRTRLALLVAVAALAWTGVQAAPAAPETNAPKPQIGPAPRAEKPEPAPDKAPAPAGDPAATAELPEILYDVSLLPEPVRRMRTRILEAALSGDPERLRIAIEANEVPPAFSFTEDGDPIAAMKKQSNDGNGLEIMAIMAEILEAGFLHVDKGTPQEMYVWPWFARYPLNKLTPAQTVEMFKIVTALEYNEMKEFGAYNFYRLGISPDGVWHFFINGD